MRELDVDFAGGLTAITGESGAGKSILLGALGVVLGDRASTETIRPGAAKADISAEFDITSNDLLRDYLERRELVDGEHNERCLLRRVINREGRSRAFVNGIPVNRSDLRQLAGHLIDIHAQDDHQRLLQREVQLSLLDDYGVEEKLRIKVRDQYMAWQETQNRLEQLQTKLGTHGDRAALLAYQVEELEQLNLAEGEVERLEVDHRRLSQITDLQHTTADALDGLGEGNPLTSLIARVNLLTDDHESLKAAQDLLNSAQSHMDEAVSELRHYQDSLETNPEALQQVEHRLQTLHDQARKHRVEPEELQLRFVQLQTELEDIGGGQDELKRLQEDVVKQKATYKRTAAKLTKARIDAAEGFCKSISHYLDALGIKSGKLSLKFHATEPATGLETVEYYVQTNPKYPAGPMSKIASGGERARIGLAIQVVAAEKTRLPSLVLDEADVGVGGTTADTLGRLLRKLAEHTQVLCVTHAPQIAALGENHLLVRKSDDADSTIEPLGKTARIAELARMLGGAEITDKTRAYARSLIANA